MTHIEARHLRIIPGQGEGYEDASDDTAAPAGSGRGRQFDYASLLGRRRAPHRLSSGANTHAGAHAQADGDAGAGAGADSDKPSQDDAGTGTPQVPRPFEREPGADHDTPWDSGNSHASARTSAHAADDAGESAERQALRARVAGAAMPVVSAVYQQQQRCIQLLGSLAREIGAFCSERAIADAGNWEVQLPLDQKLLPQTTLYLSLSRFRLQLRFDAPDTAARQLLLDHSSLLERELDTMLRAWGEAREIELTVW